VAHSPEIPVRWFAARDRHLEELAQQRDRSDLFTWAINFDGVIENTSLISDMREILRILEDTYNYPVEVEFTVNFLSEKEYRINLLQCRPLQVHQGEEIGAEPGAEAADPVIIACRGPVIGRSRDVDIHRIIYVVPVAYAPLNNQERFRVAELIGRLVHLDECRNPEFHQMLIGPGRWGTTTPALGVPVNFSQINTVQVMCEIVTMSGNLVPDVSLGTHFFNELVECDMLYMAVFPNKDGSVWNTDWLDRAPGVLASLLPDAAALAPVVKVIDVGDGAHLRCYANAMTQNALLYRRHSGTK